MENTKIEYAGFWKRFSASVIDAVVIVFFTVPILYLINSLASNSYFGGGYGRYEESFMMSYYAWSFYLLIIRWAYYAGMECSPFKGTIGKIAVGIYVTDTAGNNITFGQATGRFFGKMISGLTLYIGFMMAGFTDKKQALHDMMSNCLVLTK